MRAYKCQSFSNFGPEQVCVHAFVRERRTARLPACLLNAPPQHVRNKSGFKRCVNRVWGRFVFGYNTLSRNVTAVGGILCMAKETLDPKYSGVNRNKHRPLRHLMHAARGASTQRSASHKPSALTTPAVPLGFPPQLQGFHKRRSSERTPRRWFAPQRCSGYWAMQR